MGLPPPSHRGRRRAGHPASSCAVSSAQGFLVTLPTMPPGRGPPRGGSASTSSSLT
jgi:hypothetical protein